MAKDFPVWLVVIVAGLVVVYGLNLFGVQQLIAGKAPASGGFQQPSGGGNVVVVTQGTSLQIAPGDKQSPGTAVGYSAQVSTKTAGANGPWASYTSGTASFSGGQILDVLLTNNSVYHNMVVQDLSIPVGVATMPLPVQFNKNASVTEYVFNTLGTSVTNGGGAVNQTAIAAGGSANLKNTMYGTALQSTQDMTCVIELTAGVNASTSPQGVTLAANGANIPLKSTSVPSFYSTVGGNSRVWVFDIPALTSGAAVDYSIGITAATSKTIPHASYLIKKCYTKEWFLDTNTGKLMYDIADSTGTLKSLATYPFTVYFSTSAS